MSSPLRPRAEASRASLLVGLLLLTMALAVVLAYEANQAVRSHRLTAERALRDYAAFAARDVAANARESVNLALTDALGPVTRGKLASPYEPLASPALLAASASGALRCDSVSPGGDGERFYFRLTLRDGGFTTARDVAAATSPAAASPAAGVGVAESERWVRDTVTAHAATYRPTARYAAVLGDGAHAGSAVIYGIKYAAHGAPVAAFGFVTCRAALGAPLFAGAHRQTALLSFPFDTAGAALLGVSVRDANGRELYRAAGPSASSFVGEASMDQLGALRVRAVLSAAAIDRLVAGTSAGGGPRLSVLVAMLGLTAALAVVALVQLRREHELARQRANFTSSVSHELRTPLSQILLYGETLSLDRVRDDDERRLAAETIVQEAQRLMRMVENVLHFAHGERGSYQLAARPLLVESQLRSILTGFAPLAETGRVRLRTVLAEDAVVLADPGALRQIVLNLLDNAVKYGPAGQVVTVGARTSGERVAIWVEDEGPGVAAADRERVWRPFVRLRRAQNGASGGSGIGLSVVRELAERQGGRAWVESASPGAGGARFVVELAAARGSRAGEV